MKILFLCLLLHFCLVFFITVNADDVPQGELVVSFALPVNDGPLSDMNTIVDLSGFQPCNPEECATNCKSKDTTQVYCDSKNPKLCMCKPDNFFTADIEGTVVSVDRSNAFHKNCSIACNKRKSYARIWTKRDKNQNCICLKDKVTPTGITLCDDFAITDLCKAICQTDSAVCSFNGACLCRKNWEPFFNRSVPNVRKQEPSDLEECSNLCSGYHHDYVSRIYDSKLNEKGENKTYKFREKYCLCGEWLDLNAYNQTDAMVKQGFQLCTGLKCKRRCGSDDAICEPKFRRGCLCDRENILIGSHLWSRLPNPKETECYKTCTPHKLDPRVIEWNPFFLPEAQRYDPRYRKSQYQYLYDGKFCHCIKVSRSMKLYRPCTDEICRYLCGHYEAECDKRTRRACFCNTFQLARGLGRRADPGEVNCDIACRYGLFDGRVLDIQWEIAPDAWTVKLNKYCLCIRPTTPAGLSHCDPFNDDCQKFCGSPDAYCTREKYCHCGIVPNLLNNSMIRLGNGKEQDECGEKCHSWMWPVAEDFDNMPFIYDESLGTCIDTQSCPAIDTSPWKPEKSSALSNGGTDTLEKSEENQRKYCLCAKTVSFLYKPGTRFLMHMAPERLSKKIPCLGNHTCAIVGSGLHVIG